MPKIRKVKRRKTYKVSINRKRLRNKLRKVPTITCPQIKDAWDIKKSTKSNLVQMGLAYDPNQVLKIPNVKSDLIKSTKRRKLGELVESDDNHRVKKIPKKIQVAQELEAVATAPRQRMFKLPKGQVHFLTYLMDKYGDDYKAMANDKKNYYQLTWKQIRQKINTFKGIPEQYAEYLIQQGEIVLDDPITLEETKKRIAEENLQRYCQPKAPKKKPSVSQWIEESIEDENEDTFDTEDKLVDDDEQKEEESQILSGSESPTLKQKIKLFPDEDSDQNNDKINDKDVEKSGRTPKKNNPKKLLQKSISSDSEDSEELEEEDDGGDFKNLSDMSDDEVSDDDILNDGEFVTDSDDASE